MSAALDPRSGQEFRSAKNPRAGRKRRFLDGGPTRIGTVREFVDQILAETAGQNAKEYRVRVVYASISVRGDLNTTGFLKLTKDDLERLQMLSDRLNPELQ